MRNFLDTLQGLAGTAGDVYSKFSGKDGKATQQAAANEAARQRAAAAATADQTKLYVGIGAAVVIVLGLLVLVTRRK